MKGFALGLALKQSRNATRKSPIEFQRNSVKKNTLIASLAWLPSFKMLSSLMWYKDKKFFWSSVM